jgi:four helix bundle protein
MGVEQFGAWQKADRLFVSVVEDMRPLRGEPMCQRLIAQQVAAADSIAANIEEGYGRESPREYAQFLVIARGSAQEVRGRDGRLGIWLAAETVKARRAECDEIIALLTATIRRLRSRE